MQTNNKDSEPKLDADDMIRIAIACFIIAVCCFFGGQSMMESVNVWTNAGQAKIKNATTLIYFSYFSGIIGAVFLLAGLIKKE